MLFSVPNMICLSDCWFFKGLTACIKNLDNVMNLTFVTNVIYVKDLALL